MKDIDFSSARSKKRKLDDAIRSATNSSISSPTARSVRISNPSKIPSADKMNILYSNISKSSSKPGILSLVPEFSDMYAPITSLPEFPHPLPQLYDPNNLKLEYHELLEKCESICVVTQNMAVSVEKASRDQYKSSVWFKYCAGRITASKMKAICYTNPANSAQSPIRQVGYPKAYAFTSKQTSWGCMHEKAAKDRYEKTMKGAHTNFNVTDSGFIINPEWLFIGTTSDGMVSCDCCGKGVLEIKCPYCKKVRVLKLLL